MIQLQYENWKATLCPEYGMNTVSLLYDGEQILRAPESMEEFDRDPCVYGTPVLLPPNRTDGGKFSFGVREYALPINDVAGGNHLHGFLNRTAFVIDRQTESTVNAHYENRGEVFPFDFRMDIAARLDEKGYHQQFRITNTGAEDMPLTFGIHTNFAEKERFFVPLGQRFEKTERHIPTGRLLELDDREKTICAGFSPDGAAISGFYTAAGHTAGIGRMCYRVSPNFDQWVLYNGGGKAGFVSIEPQSGAVNALNSGVGLKILKAGQTEVFETSVSPGEI